MSGANKTMSMTSTKARRRRPQRQPYAWLGVGALTLGMGAALAVGSGVAYAAPPGGSAGSHGPTASDSTTRGSSRHSSGSPTSTKGAA